MTTFPKDTGRREHERIRLALQVAYRTAGSFLISYSVDLSRGGLFLETRSPAPVGTELDLSLSVPGVSEDVSLRGSVVWNKHEGSAGKPAGMGIQFQNVENRFGALIDSLVRTFSGLRILVVSGRPRLRSQIVRQLHGSLMAIYTELGPGDGVVAEAANHDLVILDLEAPDEAAWRRTEGILGLESPPALVACSSSGEVRQRAGALGASEVLASPSVTGELRAAVIRALGRPLLLSENSKQET